MTDHKYFDRDLSWLSFNGRILQEAARGDVPLLERVNFLAIFSSNLDEFYRVRMPVLAALSRLGKLSGPDPDTLVSQARQTIQTQQELYGKIVREQVIPGLAANNVRLLVNEAIPEVIVDEVEDYFFSQVMAFLSPVDLSFDNDFFPENNSLYLLVLLREGSSERAVVVNIPSDKLPRFFNVVKEGITYIVFIDDVIRYNLDKLFKTEKVIGSWSFKITRDAELDLKDEYPGDLSEQIEAQLLKRDSGIATRFLYQPGMPLRTLHLLSDIWNIADDSRVEGGTYHNLKDLFGLPVSIPALKYEPWPPIIYNPTDPRESIFERIEKHDQLINTPYSSYGTILRFFNEAALDEDVTEIYVTLYRVASDSRIVNALINAAKAGKKVTVLVELKARFDEANNLKWAKKMKSAGVDVIYSITALKVHAKVALVKKRSGERVKYYGLLATGNFNESTASFYTDHILITSNGDILREIELLFIFLSRREKPKSADLIKFKHLLVAQFNLQTRFFELIDKEIANAKAGKPASIKIKLNNLEERKLIDKLYEASQAGVKIDMLVRSICCLRPGIKGLSENITVKRIVDKYLEHGRMFIFHNGGQPEVYMGSADWMNRNVYRRIEVCFPVYDEPIKHELIDIMNLQLQDNVQAVWLNEQIENVPVDKTAPLVHSQKDIYTYLKEKKLPL
ncbi:polyphosphate kinase 1 [Mucilaginibacter myungsuensis]|uniref:Polyphosphate kinase n=1 Tax=Mucilaginibacter myungsuensis TaxID=649104 RepID=A0A929PUL8_9SPHI|nr:polyphosphate kinase 1 [Mucilaginibacter myungsuensis]MBE9660259.1 polyphosphate kinase 1 [Mucilaginibacter myungsuensis]MDN3600301.1 polyphosphate kinase 1 [Mucilaginibacter myungsuensis]